MKKLLFTLFLAVFAMVAAQAQVPKYFNYHGVVAEKNSPMTVLVTIIDIANDPNLSQSEHPVVYGESHMVKTNPNGAFTLKIGSGSRTGSASFENVDFSKGAYGVKIIAGTHTSVFPLVSVPYALVAQSMPGFAEAQQDIEDLKSLLSDYKTLLSKVESLEKDNESLKKSASKIETIEGNISSLDSRVSALEAGGGDDLGGDDETSGGTTAGNGKENGYEYVDLGLSVKWATCNVGASKPEEYGDYFAWGETSPKSYYDWSTYKWCNGSENTMTKYCTNSSFGTVDNKTTLDLSDDAARANWGGSWRMPTHVEQEELREICTWTWTTLNGVNGYKVTSKKNGNSIFLPAAGYRIDNSFDVVGSDGRYWSSSLNSSYSFSAYEFNFYSSRVNTGSEFRYYGLSVRAICP